MEFYIGNVRIIRAEGVLDGAWVHVVDGKIREIGEGKAPPEQSGSADTTPFVDGRGQWLAPGFIDMHIHGGDGADVMDGTVRALETIARFHASHGTTSWLPTTLTAPFSEIRRVLDAVASLQKQPQQGAEALGVHLEGPFLSSKRIGAQNPAYLAEPSLAAWEEMVGSRRELVRKMTIAPEVPGALELIAHLHEVGVIPSLGHTDATFEEADRVIRLGHCHATHLFNGMRGLHHREPGVLAACLLSENVALELIVDGIHLEPQVVKMVLRTAGPERVCLITDAMAAAGRPDGQYELGGLAVTVEGGKAYLTEGHNIAGSTLTMDAAVRNMVRKVGVSLPDAVRMASLNPARELGIADRKGDIAVGLDADLVLLDESFSVVRTWVQGREVFIR